MGTPGFAVPALEGLLSTGHDVVAVYTLPDKPAGRGRALQPSPVKVFASTAGLPVYTPASWKEPGAVEHLAGHAPQAIVVAAYGRFLPKSVLELPPLGCLNVHPSLLPRYRGPSPVASAILEGDETTGVTIMLLDQGMDTGPILAQEETRIAPQENAETLTARLFQMGARLLVRVLSSWADGRLKAVPQDNSRATTTRLLKKEDGLMDWQKPAETLGREVRAFYPWPGSYTFWRGKTLKVLEAIPVPPGPVGGEGALQKQPGVVITIEGNAVGVATGRGALRLERLQLEGRGPLSIGDFLRGHPDFVGSLLGQG